MPELEDRADNCYRERVHWNNSESVTGRVVATGAPRDFNHWVTYAEVLQLIASLALGIFLTLKQKKNLTGVLLLLTVTGSSLHSRRQSHARRGSVLQFRWS